MDQDTQEARRALSQLKRIVVKVGSRAIIGDDRNGEPRFQVLAEQISTLRTSGYEVILVSSGSVALGRQRLAMEGRPTELPRLQAAAAVGQSQLMGAYEAAFQHHDILVGQVLLTHDGVADRRRYLNARDAVDALLELSAVPIVNENDAVSTEEIEFGDNDQLAALVASLVGADLLIILTDVEGLLDENRQRIAMVHDIEKVVGHVWAHDSTVSVGGMASKLGASRRALLGGLPVVIAPARDPGTLPKVLAGEDIGTLFLPAGSPLPSRKHWIAHTLKPSGQVVVDAGAAAAICRDGSLLPAGICGVEGEFRAGEAVSICAEDGTELARGLTRYDAAAVARLLGASSRDIEARVNHYNGDAVVPRDDLVVL